MVQHDDSGAMGVVLNRPTGKNVRDIWTMVSEEPCDCESAVFLGGPVRGPIAVVHTLRAHSNIEIIPGLYFTIEEKALGEVVRAGSNACRIFIGYSGWAPGQLESELNAGGWLTTAVSVDDVFGQPHEQWQNVSRRIGREFLVATVKPKVLPDDPSMN
jgi:putative transcriptional regulator